MIHTAKQLKDKVRNQSCGNSRVVWLRRVNQEIQPYTKHLIAGHKKIAHTPLKAIQSH